MCYLFVETMHKGRLKLGRRGWVFENSFSDKTGVMNENIIDKILFDFMQWVLLNIVLGLGIFMRSIFSVVV